MPKYEYGRIAKLAESLAEAGIAQDIRDQIMAGGEKIRRGTKPEAKAAWMREAMQRMDALLDEGTRHAVREACACSLGGQRLEISQGIARKGGTLEERIQAANATRYVFGHSVTLQADGTALVSFAPAGLPEYRCVCLPKANGPLSITYCYCCGGHAKHHLQTALGRKLAMKVRSSALASGGKEPCSFVFSLVN